jgi:nucleoside-diphosphate-sugar epimerase
MKVLLAGASGALGIPLTRGLIAHNHQVIGLTRGRAGADRIAALGATPVVVDALNRDSLLRSLAGLSADAVIHELTALRKPPLRHSGMALTDLLRSKGTTNLLAAADALGAKRFLTQSIIFGYGYYDHGDRVLTEQSPFGDPAGNASDPHIAAMRSAEDQAFTAPEGSTTARGTWSGCCHAARGDRDCLADRLHVVPVASSRGRRRHCRSAAYRSIPIGHAAAHSPRPWPRRQR